MRNVRRWYRFDLLLFEALYRGYVAALSMRSDPESRRRLADRRERQVPFALDSDAGFEELDARATALGNQYRGLGVLVGALGAVIVLLAVIPVGLELRAGVVKAIALAKVALMGATVVFIWIFGYRARLRTRWIAARLQAELTRYRDLSQAIDRLKATRSPEQAAAVRSRLDRILNDPEQGQIGYNQRRAETYMVIEERSDRIGWLGFWLTLLAAMALLLSDLEILKVRNAGWLIFGTTWIPAVVAAVHGINGFLQIGALADQHMHMAERLQELWARLKDPSGAEPGRVLEVAELVYRQLMDRDAQWVETALKHGLTPV